MAIYDPRDCVQSMGIFEDVYVSQTISSTDGQWIYTYPYPQPVTRITLAPFTCSMEKQRVEETLSDMEHKEEPVNERGLYRVYIVDPETSEVFATGAFVAGSEGSAKIIGFNTACIRRNQAEAEAKPSKSPDDYDILVERVGSVRPKKETK